MTVDLIDRLQALADANQVATLIKTSDTNFFEAVEEHSFQNADTVRHLFYQSGSTSTDEQPH